MIVSRLLLRTQLHSVYRPLPYHSSRLFRAHGPIQAALSSPTTLQRFRENPYVQLARLDKPIGSWLLYWPCAWSLTMASTYAAVAPSTLLWNLALFGSGALVMRGAGCTINDMWDTKIDRKVDRTKTRPLAAGKISHPQAWAFLAAQMSAGLAILTQLNLQSVLLGATSLFVVVLYPLMKRITYWPQFVLGLAFNWGALLGPVAILGYLEYTIYLPLYAGSVAWTIFYDTIYAHQDKTDDVQVGVKSTALLFRDQTKPILAGFGTAFVGMLGLAGHLSGAGPCFWIFSIAGSAMHLAWQLATVNLANRESCWQRFKSNRDLGAIIWGGLALDYLSTLYLF